MGHVSLSSWWWDVMERVYFPKCADMKFADYMDKIVPNL